ncbi:MAG TPA: hypothetical protein VEU97_16620, partial [Ktedonobacteraceae bacterium]|nr:hypothetical protein [Ktedonobacteraceae bacterium]
MVVVTNNNRFVFRQHDRIGDPSAEFDHQFLTECFIDNGNLAILTNCKDPRAILAGRTGSGKSALLSRLKETKEHVLEIQPKSLALGYISNSTILSFFHDIGVKLDLFYQFLWQHVFVVELVKAIYDIEDENSKLAFFDKLQDIVLGRRGRIEAFKYLNEYGTKFWQTTEARIKETTSIIEKELTGHTGLDISHIATLEAGGKLHLSEQEKQQVKKRGTDIINNIQMSKLSDLLSTLDENILTNPMKNYYIVVDQLDESWVEEEVRYRLIRGLIETIRIFNRKVRNAKIIIALRTDLIYQIYKVTSDSGFQSEKYLALNLNITWSREDLANLLDKRVTALVRQRYTRQPVRLTDVLPMKIGKGRHAQSGVEYLLDRTLLRPRDAIQFFNTGMNYATNEPTISPGTLVQAEAEYSQYRVNAIADEWSERYPYFRVLVSALRGFPCNFRLSEINADLLDAIYIQIDDIKDKKET